jgi:hypothetical protein
VITLLADLDALGAVCLAVTLFAASLVPFFLLVGVRTPSLRDVRRSAVVELAAVRWFQARDLLRDAVRDVRIALARRLDPNSPAPKRGAHR